MANPLFASANSSDISAPAFESSNPLARRSLIGSDPVSDLLRVASLRAVGTDDPPIEEAPRTDDVPWVRYFPSACLLKCSIQLGYFLFRWLCGAN